ncbi:MAG: transporter ATP-binding protein, partial [Rhizobacter sp.]|nr:transporter ATP-binding protein [Rhizobacter sp.]
EQNPKAILGMTHRAVVLDRGQVVHRGTSADLLADSSQLDKWLAVSRG